MQFEWLSIILCPRRKAEEPRSLDRRRRRRVLSPIGRGGTNLSFPLSLYREEEVEGREDVISLFVDAQREGEREREEP